MFIVRESKFYSVIYLGTWNCGDGYEYILFSFRGKVRCAPVSFYSDLTGKPNVGDKTSILGFILQNCGTLVGHIKAVADSKSLDN